ncbi:hypothetical protein HMPREF1624_08777 [Sporothrix schenckii ATCC 58251]|uniref:Cyclic nucleotide-binding domain-containing protein n=1 Tax=Sporothrix schenckii (strain ATCC 58251 / de Perez 2211183) TaxID=1391915 RepID=U7PJK3_SPOS1|nr:hypothetical protein HMPREF1624_08777 [Sporothrix schenckii ATCC 58251]
MRRARGPSPTSPFRALAHQHATHNAANNGAGGQGGTVSSMIRSFNVETNPTRPIRPSPLTASTFPDMPLDLVDRIRSFPLFVSAPDDFLAAIGKHLRPQIHAAHDLILTEGDDAKAMYWLVRGVVAVTSRDGEAVYAELTPGAFFGEIGVLMDVPRTATIVARSKCLLVVLKKEDLQTELPRYPDMEKAIRQEAEERLTILKKKQQERRNVGTSGSTTTPSSTQSGDITGASTTAAAAAAAAAATDAQTAPTTTPTNKKKRKSPSPGIIEDPAVGGSALGSGYVNVRKTLKELPLFATLPPDILHFLGLSAQPKTFAPFTDIICQGSPGNDIYFIVRGEAEVILELPKGRLPETASTFARPRLTQGQYFGEVASLGLSRGRTATVRSITSVECLIISGEALDELWRRCPPGLKDQVEATARERYHPTADGDDDKRTDESQQPPENDQEGDVEMRDEPDGGSPWRPTPSSPVSSLASLRRHSVPNVTFTTPSKPSSPTKASQKDETAETRQPSDPDPFLSVDMENMRNRRRNSLAPPVPQTESPASSPSSSSSLSSSSSSSTLQALPVTQAGEATNSNSSPLKLFAFPPQTAPPPSDRKDKEKADKGAASIIDDFSSIKMQEETQQSQQKEQQQQQDTRGPYKKARRSPSAVRGTNGDHASLATTSRQFPPEAALVLVLKQFDFLELVRLAGTCRHWRRVITTAPQLCTHIDLAPYNGRITDWSLLQIVAPLVGQRAVEIDISNCFHITDEGFQALWQHCGRNVKAWRMKSVWDVSANQILDMSEHATGLEELDWSNCRKVGDNLLARVVGWVVPPAPAASASGSGAATSNKIVAIANSNRSRQAQKQQPQRQPQDDAASKKENGPAPGTIVGCPQLTILDLSYCKHITDRSMVHLAAHASSRLRALSLTRCTSVTDAGFQAWAPYRFTALTHLCLADCTYLSDNAIVSLVNAAKGLTHLDLSFCCALSDTATEVVALGLPLLQELRLAFCGSAVSDASLRCVALHLQDLRGLSVRGCVRVTGVGVDHVMDGCTRLAWLDASQCKNLASWVAAGGVARWGYDERQEDPRGGGAASKYKYNPTGWQPASRRTLGLDPAFQHVAKVAAPAPAMRGQRRRARQPVKFIIEKGSQDGLR